MQSNAQTNDSNRPMQATMIQARDVNFGPHTNLKMINKQINDPNHDKRYALNLLRASCSLAALLDANERHDPPRCSAATRRDIIHRLEDWVRHDDHRGTRSGMFWLHGGAGVGKSALAQTLAEKFQTSKDLAASFFFSKAEENRNDGNCLIPTLAHQLAQSFQGLSPFVEQRILQNQDLFTKSRRTQMSELLVEPLKSLSLEETDNQESNVALRSHPRLVVIDGLDQCHDPVIQRDLLRIIASAIPNLPYALRFLITSRPEYHLRRVFQHDLGKVARYDLSDDPEAVEDIRHFLDGEFANIRSDPSLGQHLPSPWPPRGAINSIVERSSGHFIYASTVIQFIQDPKFRPDTRLQVILGLRKSDEEEQPYAPLDKIYSLIFLEEDPRQGEKNLRQDKKRPRQLEKIHRALGIMHLRSLKSGLFALTRLTSNRRAIEMLLELEPGDIVSIFSGLLSLVAVDENNIRVFHKSLFDYLLDSSRSRDLHLDLGLAHENAANYIVKQLEDRWESKKFQALAYHCQFARLNDTLTGHLRSRDSDSKIIFPETLSGLLVPSQRFSLLQSILYFLQVMGRQDFDPTGHYYRMYVTKMTQYLRSISQSSLKQRLKNMSPKPDVLSDFKRCLRSSSQVFLPDFDLKDLQVKLNVSGRTPVPASTKVESIKHEHVMFSSYVEARYGNPNITVSLLESNKEFIHSCHFVMRAASSSVPTFVMLVTYTQKGDRLSCTEFDDITLLNAQYLVKQHLQRTQNEVYNNHITVYSSTEVSAIPI